MEKCLECLDSFRGYFAYDLNLIGEGLGHRRFFNELYAFSDNRMKIF